MQRPTARAQTLDPTLHRALDRHVADIRVWPSAAGGPRYVERLPDGAAIIVFRAASRGGGGDLTAAGAVSRAVYKRAPGEPRVITAEFKLGGAYPFFGVPMHLLTDRLVPLEELWGAPARGLLDRLVGCRDDAEAVEIVERALAAQLERSAHLELRSAVHVLRAVRRLVTREHLDVAGLASGVGLSERQLRRVFATAVGIGPKEYLRMLRFHRAVRSLAMPGGQLAVAAGYYDQAHLIAEFRHMARMTPRDFAKRRRAERDPRGLLRGAGGSGGQRGPLLPVDDELSSCVRPKASRP
jgi:AraC-like DNA-binding protein